MSSVRKQQFFWANNHNLPNYDASKPSIYAIILVSNHFDDGVMQNDYLPLKNLALDTSIMADNVFKLLSTAMYGFIIEVDID